MKMATIHEVATVPMAGNQAWTRPAADENVRAFAVDGRHLVRQCRGLAGSCLSSAVAATVVAGQLHEAVLSAL